MVNFTSKTYQMKRARPAGSPPPVGFASFYRTITELSIRPFKCPVNTPKPRSERKSGENQKYYDRLTIDDKVVHELKNWHKQIHLHSIKI